MIYGVIGGLFLAPADYQQGDAYRIIYLHVPAAFSFISRLYLSFYVSQFGYLFNLAAKSCRLYCRN